MCLNIIGKYSVFRNCTSYINQARSKKKFISKKENYQRRKLCFAAFHFWGLAMVTGLLEGVFR